MSFGTPEKSNPVNDQEDFDFAKSLDTYDPSVKIAELTAKITSTERGIKLAAQLNDPGRIAEMQKRKGDFEAALKILQAELPKSTPVEAKPEAPKNRFDVADMDEADSRTARIGAAEDRSARRLRP